MSANLGARQAPDVNDTRRGDEHVDPAELGDHLRREVEHLLPVGHVDRVDHDCRSTTAEPACLGQRFHVAARQRQTCALSCQRNGQGAADTRAGPGDHDHPVGVVAHGPPSDEHRQAANRPEHELLRPFERE